LVSVGHHSPLRKGAGREPNFKKDTGEFDFWHFEMAVEVSRR